MVVMLNACNWHPVSVTLFSDSSSAMNNCRPWNPMPNPPYNTGKSIDNGVCPEGSHYLGLHYKLISIVPVEPENL
ncbi:MAG: hypothetical protein ACK4K9_06750 [Bacteroidia bacterium]